MSMEVMFPKSVNGVTYAQFQRIIEDIKTYDDFADKLSEVTNEGISLYEMNAVTTILEDLRAILAHFLGEDFNDYTTIDYYIYELDYGTMYKDGDCTYDYRMNGDIIETPLRNVRELWLYFAMDNKVINKEEYFSLLNDNCK